MVAIAPVAAFVVEAAHAPHVVGPAYDSLRPHQRRHLADADADSFFNVVRSVADYPEGDAPPDLIEGNLAALRRLLERGRYRAHAPSLFVHRIATHTHAQTALVGDLLVAETRSGVIRAHEHTRVAKEAELAHHLRVLRMQSSPVGLGYRHDARLDELVSEVTGTEPELDFVAADGLRQEVWVVPAGLVTPLSGAVGSLGQAYIVDGHHRVAASGAVDPGGRFLAALVPDDQLRLFPYHRLVAGPLQVDDALVRLGTRFEITPLPGRPADEPGRPDLGPDELRVVTPDRWWSLRRREPAAGQLPAAVADDLVLGVGFGIADPRHDRRLDYVPGNAPVASIAELVAARQGAAVLLASPTVEQVFAEADAGRTLPPKSTWFEPKLRSGVFVVER